MNTPILFRGRVLNFSHKEVTAFGFILPTCTMSLRVCRMHTVVLVLDSYVTRVEYILRIPRVCFFRRFSSRTRYCTGVPGNTVRSARALEIVQHKVRALV